MPVPLGLPDTAVTTRDPHARAGILYFVNAGILYLRGVASFRQVDEGCLSDGSPVWATWRQRGGMRFFDRARDALGVFMELVT